MNLMKLLMTVFLLLSLSACNGIRLNTIPSVDESLRTYKVQEYSIAEIQRYKAESLGKVVSSYCRTRPTQPKPTESFLLGELKYKTQRLGGNGVVIMECVDHRLNNSCNDYLECRALAYRVDFDSL
ncbi:conserved hypothetical protein [Shewanella sediminis HAW-EB3]|uniref:Lipoprotein n=2 Tax=Shewanella sediminis TaxID=271097 RepID=A8G0L9_SHESH|nr:conserved hypothetical protein [Shewanella sediminis HAW-EB3]